MPISILGRLRDLLGGPAVGIDAQGVPRAVPDTLEGASLVLGAAYDEGWRVRVEGQATWMAPDAEADLALGTRGLDRVLEVDPERALVRAEAGVSLDELRRAIGDDGLWLPLDPPGRPERTRGSVVATATAGPLRTWAGSVRELVVGAGVLTGAGRLVASPADGEGPRDLPRLAAGSFGAAGVIAWAELRLEPVPRVDRTFLARAPRDRLTEAGRALVEAGVGPAAAEILSPAWGADPEWSLAVRLMGDGVAVNADAQRLVQETDLLWNEIPATQCGALWDLVARAPLSAPLSFRLGVLPDGLDDALDLVADQLDEGLVSAGAVAGDIRWAGDAPVDRLRSVRARAAARELPLTLERGPWSLRSVLGHAGAYREGGAPPLARLREEFDPGNTLVLADGGQ